MIITLSKFNERPIKQLSKKHQRKNRNDNSSDKGVYQFTREFDEY